LCPEQRVEWTTADQTRPVYRGAPLRYVDSDNRAWAFTGIACEQTPTTGEESTWAGVTALEVSHQAVDVALKGGRQRWRVENEGFNAQKNSGLNMEHAFRHTNWAAYYYLLPIAHMLLQLVEKGSLLMHMAQEHGKRTAVDLFGNSAHVARRLLESVRYLRWPEDAFDVAAARKTQIRFDNSS
jgi:hypothetical protein